MFEALLGGYTGDHLHFPDFQAGAQPLGIL